MTKSILNIILLLITWVELILLTILLYATSFLPKRILGKKYAKLFRGWCWLFVRALNVDLRIHQKNTKTFPDHYILIANHPSAFEDVGIPALFPVTCVAKDEVKQWYFAGRINIAAGTLFVKRDKAESRSQLVRDMVAEVSSGNNLALYPEGGCFGRRINKFKNGAFIVSMETGVPIIPVFIQYEMQDVFEWRDPQTLPQKLWQFLTCQNSRANYYVYDAIDPKQFNTVEEYHAYVTALYLDWQEKYLN